MHPTTMSQCGDGKLYVYTVTPGFYDDSAARRSHNSRNTTLVQGQPCGVPAQQARAAPLDEAKDK